MPGLLLILAIGVGNLSENMISLILDINNNLYLLL